MIAILTSVRWCCVCAVLSCSVVSNSLWPYGLQSTRLSVLGNSPGKNNGVEKKKKRILEWVAMFPSRGYSQPRDQTQVSHTAGRFFTNWATKEAEEYWSGQPIPSPGDLPDPGIEPGLLYYRWILYQLSYQGSPTMTLFSNYQYPILQMRNLRFRQVSKFPIIT